MQTPRSTTSTWISKLTSNAPAAIAVLEVVGPNAERIIAECWQPNRGIFPLRTNRIRFGTMRSDSAFGESVVVCKTDEHRIELHCHGGVQAASLVMEEFVRFGAIERSVQDKLVNEIADAFELEAIQDLTRCETLRTTSILMDQWRGALRLQWNEIESLLHAGRNDEAKQLLQRLRDRYGCGSHLIEPWQIVLAGPPNVGKSSLLNRMLGYSRAIVHEHAGTTRDLLIEKTSWDGWPLVLIDGAGIRGRNETNDGIESIGVQRTLETIRSADCVLLLIDCQTGLTPVHEAILDSQAKNSILVVTKSDLAVESATQKNEKRNELAKRLGEDQRLYPMVKTSAQTGQGIAELMDAVLAQLIPTLPRPGDAVPFRPRHFEWINARLNGLANNAIRVI